MTSYLITLTQVALVSDTFIEQPCRLDPMEIVLQEKGTQKTTALPILGEKNSVPCTIITFKNGKQVAVKEDFAQIDEVLANA